MSVGWGGFFSCSLMKCSLTEGAPVRENWSLLLRDGFMLLLLAQIRWEQTGRRRREASTMPSTLWSTSAHNLMITLMSVWQVCVSSSSVLLDRPLQRSKAVFVQDTRRATLKQRATSRIFDTWRRRWMLEQTLSSLSSSSGLKLSWSSWMTAGQLESHVPSYLEFSPFRYQQDFSLFILLKLLCYQLKKVQVVGSCCKFKWT